MAGVALAVLVVLLSAWLIGRRAPPASSDGAVHSESSTPTHATGSRHGTVDAAAGTQASHAGSQAPASPSSRLIRVGDPMYGVRTQAEADWLNRNRFPLIVPGILPTPTAADLDGPLTGEAIGRAEAASMLRPELRDRAVERLKRAAEDGSIGALHALSRAYQHRKRDLLLADAYARAAELRGDWNPRIRTFTLGPLEEMASPVVAHRILHDIDRARRTRGLAPLVRDERPGLVEASDRILQAHRTGGLRLPEPPRP